MRRADCSVRVGHRHERLLFKEVSTGEYLLVEVLLLVRGNNVLRLLLYFCQGWRPHRNRAIRGTRLAAILHLGN